MRKLRYLLSWVMVFSICCLALSGGALAADDGSSYSIVVGYGGTITVPDLLYGIGTEPVNDLGRVSVNTATSKYNYYDYVSMRKPITGLTSSNEIVNLDLGTVTQKVQIGSQTASGFSGTIGIAAYLAYQEPPTGQSTSYWISGSGAIPSSWEMSVEGRNLLGETVTKTLSGSGGSAAVDVKNLTTLESITIEWYFGIKTLRLPAGHDYKTVYPSFRTITNAMVSTANSDANRQEQVIEGINETNNILSGINSGISNIWQGIVSLPGKIAEAIKGLFVPSDAQMIELKAAFNTLLSEKLGFVYQAVSLVDGVFDAVFDAVDNPNSDVSFTVPAFPSFDVAGTDVSLWTKPINVDISENEVVQTVQEVASPFVVAVMIWGFVHSMEDAFLAFVGGQSLADWVRNRKEDPE